MNKTEQQDPKQKKKKLGAFQLERIKTTTVGGFLSWLLLNGLFRWFCYQIVVQFGLRARTHADHVIKWHFILYTYFLLILFFSWVSLMKNWKPFWLRIHGLSKRYIVMLLLWMPWKFIPHFSEKGTIERNTNK